MKTLQELLAEQEEIFASIDSNIAELKQQKITLEKQVDKKEADTGLYTVEGVKATKDLKSELSILNETIALAEAKRRDMIEASGVSRNTINNAISSLGMARAAELQSKYGERLDQAISELFAVVALFDDESKKAERECLSGTNALRKFLEPNSQRASFTVFMARNNSLKPLEETLRKNELGSVLKAYYDTHTTR